MVHVLKIYVASRSELPDIRRVTVNSDVLNSYEKLVEKVISVIPKLNKQSFELCWKDDDGDDVVVTNDDELAQAIANSEDGVIKIYVRFTDMDAKQKNCTTGEGHVGVVCDGCNEGLIGYRYKCLQCEDFDLCHACNASGKHPFHDMLKLVSPARYSRQWLFVGWKRFFKSLFGFEPATEMIDRYENPPKCPFFESQRLPHPPRNVPLEELFKDGNVNLLENVGQFVTNLLSPWGVDVKVDIDHSRKESSASKSEEAKEKVQKDPESPEHSAAKSVEGEEQKPKMATAESKSVEEAIATAAESKCSEEIVVKPTVAESKCSEETLVKPTVAECKNVKVEAADPNIGAEDPKRDEETKPKSAFEILNEIVQVVSGGARPKSKGPSTIENIAPVLPEMSHGLFARHFDESVQVSDGTAEGFTVITTSLLNGADEKAKAETTQHPLPLAVDQKVQYPVLDEELVAMNEETTSDGTKTTSPEQHFSSDLDPLVVNALNKMTAMGFTNEGGWLLRLLQTKKGNINEALDSLYPNSMRR